MTPTRWISGPPGRDALTLAAFEPPAPGPGELLVAVSHAALNFSDVLMLEDRYQVRPPRPFTPGQEIAGTVLTAGAGCAIAPGTAIAGKVDWGGFATHALIPEAQAIPLTPGIDPARAAALPVVYTTAYVALTEVTRLAEGETLFVPAAAGGTGLAAVQIGRSLGAHVIGMASSEAKRDVARQAGAATVIDPATDWWDGAARAAGTGLDVVFDTIGGDTTLKALDLLAMDGRLLIVGFAGAPPAKIPAHRLLLKRARALGVYWNHQSDREMLARVTARMMSDLADGHIAPLIDLRGGLEALPAALADLAGRRSAGKIVLELAP